MILLKSRIMSHTNSWSDTYHSLRFSMRARAGMKYHVERLAGLASHSKGLFPRQRAPQWLMGDPRGASSSGSSAAVGEEIFENPSGKNLNGNYGSQDGSAGTTQHTRVPGIIDLRSSISELTYPVIMKAALAILNVHLTGAYPRHVPRKRIR